MKCVGLKAVLPAANNSRDETAYIMHANSECVDEYALETCEKLTKLCPETVELIKENVKTVLSEQARFKPLRKPNELSVSRLFYLNKWDLN